MPCLPGRTDIPTSLRAINTGSFSTGGGSTDPMTSSRDFAAFQTTWKQLWSGEATAKPTFSKGVSTGGIQVAVWISATPDRQPIGGASPRASRQPSNGPMGGPTSSVEKNTTDSMTNCSWYVCVWRNMVRVILGYIILSCRLSDDWVACVMLVSIHWSCIIGSRVCGYLI